MIDISIGGNMKRLESHKKENLREKHKEQESQDLDEEMVRRLYIGPDSGG
jgi:hypothetical protein